MRAKRQTLGLTQAECASLLGVDKRTWKRWEAGDRAIPPPVAKLTEMMVLPVVLLALKRMEGYEP